MEVLLRRYFPSPDGWCGDANNNASKSDNDFMEGASCDHRSENGVQRKVGCINNATITMPDRF